MSDLRVTDAPEVEVARDMARRALPVVPVWLLGAALLGGRAGALSAAYAFVLVVGNFLLSASIIERASRISPAAIVAAVLVGYPVRLGLITIAVLVISGAWWFAPIALGTTLVVTHLGLLAWESRHVSLSLAYPGLAPGRRS